jgi:hypothetical protein
MKKLIKISDYRHVIEDKMEIKEGDYYICEENKLEDNYIIVKNYYKNFQFKDLTNVTKIIATTDPSLPLPQITNASDELVGKEVEVEFKTIEVPISSYGISYAMGKGEPNTEEKEVAILKPISKETISDERLNDFTEENLMKGLLADEDDFKSKETSTNEPELDGSGFDNNGFNHYDPKLNQTSTVIGLETMDKILNLKEGELIMIEETSTNETLLQFPSNNLKELLYLGRV